MIDEINIVANVKRLQYFSQWKVTSIIWKMEDDLNYLENGRRPQLFGKWKTTSIIWKMEDDFNYLENIRRPQSLINHWRKMETTDMDSTCPELV